MFYGQLILTSVLTLPYLIMEEELKEAVSESSPDREV